MAISFPTSPANNQIYSANTKSWIWTGNAWKAISSTNGVGVVRSSARLVTVATAGQTIITTPAYIQGANQVSVFINGVKQYNTDFDETTNTSITLVNAASLGDSILTEVNGYTGGSTISINTPSITDAILNANYYPLISPSNSGSITVLNTSSPNFSFNPTTGVLSVPTIKFTDNTTITTSFLPTSSYANGAFLQANSAAIYANGAFIQANAAFLRANNSLNANTGGTVTGNLTLSTAGSILIQNTQASTTTTTGALIVSGGIGVAGNVTAGNLVSSIITTTAGSNANVAIDPDGTGYFVVTSATPTVFANTTASTSNVTGSVVFSGGVGISGNVYSGNHVIIGTGTINYNPATTTGAGLNVTAANTQGGIGYSDFLKVTNTSAGSTNANKSFRLNSTGGIEIVDSAYTATIFSLTDAGALTATTVTSSSDENLKENITTIKNPIDTIKKLRGVEYDWRDNNQHSMGVVAQELEKILPYLVHETDNGKSVMYSNMIGLLIEAIKEQQKQIDELKSIIHKNN